MIADYVGVSRSTVSLALRNDRTIPKETKQRVLAAAEHLKYRPNPLVAALMTHLRKGSTDHRYDHLALLQQADNSIAVQLTYQKWVNGARERAKQLGYTVTDLSFDRTPQSGQRIDRILRARGIAGIIIAPTLSPTLGLALKWEHYALGSIQFTHEPNLHCSCNNHLKIIVDCIAELRKLGYTRIGLYLDKKNDLAMHHAWLGYYLADQHGQPRSHRIEPLLCENSERSRDGFLQWVKRNKPNVVIAIERNVLAWLKEAGFGVPEQIGVALLDRHEEEPWYAGIDQQHSLVGAAAVDLVTAQLNRNERGLPASIKIVNVSGRWIPGPSVRSPVTKMLANGTLA